MSYISPKKVALIFDLDGTIIHSKDKLVQDIILTLETLGTDLTDVDPNDLMETSFQDLARKYGLGQEDFHQTFDRVRPSWEQAIADGTVYIYPDSIPALDMLVDNKYTKMGLVSRSEPSLTKTKLEAFDLAGYFKAVEVTPPDRDKFPFKTIAARKALDVLQKDSEIHQVYLIGDSESDDIGTARDLKAITRRMRFDVKSVYVNRNDRSLRRLKADHEVRDLSDLYLILEVGRQI